MKTLLFHPVNGIIRIQGCLFLCSLQSQEQSIYRDRLGVYQRHGDSIAEPGDDSGVSIVARSWKAKMLGKSDLKKPHGSFHRIFFLLTKKSGIRWGILNVGVQGVNYARNLSLLGAFWVRIQLPCSFFQALCISAPEFGWWMHVGAIGMPIWNRSPSDFRNWFYHPSNIPCQWYHPWKKPLVRLIPSNDASLMIQWFYPPLRQFSSADLEGVPAYSPGGVWLKLTKGGSSSNRKVPRKNETKVDAINQHEDVSVTSQ